MSVVKLGRQTEIGEHIRIYHSRVLLSAKQIPLVECSLPEIAARAHAMRQEQVLESNIDMLKSSISGGGVETARGAPKESTEHPIVTAVMELPGVEFTYGAGYQLVVFKGRQFLWDELESSIKRLLTTFSLPLENVTLERVANDKQSSEE